MNYALLSMRSRHRSSADVDHDLAGGIVAFERAIRLANRRQRETSRIDAGRELAGLVQPGRFAQNVAVMRAAFTRQHRQQREHA